MKYLFSFFLICNSIALLGQQDTSVYDIPEIEAKFIDGSTGAWFAKNIIYPKLEMENSVEGEILIRFIVEIDGSLSAVKVVRSKCFKTIAVGEGEGKKEIKVSLEGDDDNKLALEMEAVSKVKVMPKWKAGENNGVPCRSKFQVKIVFKLG
jgi:hypothetical protein